MCVAGYEREGGTGGGRSVRTVGGPRSKRMCAVMFIPGLKHEEDESHRMGKLLTDWWRG